MSLLKDIPKGSKAIFSEVEYSELKKIEDVKELINNYSSQYDIRDIFFMVEEKLSGYRPENKWYVGGEIMFIIKYIEPRTSIQHDMVGDKELCILHPRYFNVEEIVDMLAELRKEKNK